MKLNLDLALQLAGWLHLGLLCAGLMMPRVVQMGAHLAALPPFIRQLFWVYYSFIALCVVSFCVITLTFSHTLAAGGALGRALCAFFAVFWTMRWVVGAFVFEMRPYLTSPFRRLGYRALNLVFTYLPLVYAWAALKGGNA